MLELCTSTNISLLVPSLGTNGSYESCPRNDSLLHDGQCVATCHQGDSLPLTCWNGSLSSPSACCADGTAWDGINSTSCGQCPPGQRTAGLFCVDNVCRCPHGVAASGPTCTRDWQSVCASCDSGYTLARLNTACDLKPFGALNGVKSRSYEFRAAALVNTSGSYSSGMVAACLAYGMKPICDHPRYCQWDPDALYMGRLDTCHLRQTVRSVSSSRFWVSSMWTGRVHTFEAKR